MEETVEQALAAFAEKPRALELEGVVQHYEWGGASFIPHLLGDDNAAAKPCAELWIGAHPSAPSRTEINGVPVTLDQLQKAAPDAVLGSDTARRFGGRLPYLFKVLDAHKMLSIQAHPTKRQAEEGFARENQAGIDLKAPNRNYKDDNHKPEVHVALTDFWMLHGFRPLDDIGAALAAVPELADLAANFRNDLQQAASNEDRSAALRALYERVMTMPQEDVDRRLNPLVERLHAQKPTDKDTPDFWALRAAEHFPLPGGYRDRGIVSIYLMNLVRLRPGQGTFQAAGVPHAYLEGVNMELMANSDNVLRGGLTPKHVDVPELMRTLVFEGGTPDILNGASASDTETVYRAPVDEFSLSRIDVQPGRASTFPAGHGPDALIVLDGEAAVRAGDTLHRLGRGRIVFVPPALDYTVEASNGPAVLYRASVPAAA